VRNLSLLKGVNQIDILNLLKDSEDITVFTLNDKAVITAVEGEHLTKDVQEYLNIQYFTLICEEDRNRVQQTLRSVYLNSIKQLDYRLQLFDNTVAHVHTTFIPVVKNEKVSRVIGIISEITITNEIEESLKRGQDLYQHLMSHTDDITVLIDEEGEILTANILSKEDVIAAYEKSEKGNIFYYIVEEDRKKMAQQLRALIELQQEKAVFEICLFHKRTGLMNCECIITNHLQTEGLNGFICTFRDITELKRKTEEIHFLTHVDCLTGLYNRRFLEFTTNQVIEYAKFKNHTLGLLVVDINNFNYINNLLGHEVGDQILRQVAQVLKELTPKFIQIVGRISGDQFAVVTHDVVTESEINDIANALKKAMEHQQLSSILNVDLSITIGASMYPDGGETFKELLEKAGLALFMAKKEEVFLKIYSPTVSIDSFKLFEMEKALKESLQLNQFFMVYQPIYHIDNHEIYAVESLIRWEHPKLGIVSPQEFIPLAEESGLIIELGEWILDNICQFYMKYKLYTTPIKLTYNMSPIQFMSPSLVINFQAILQKYEIPYSKIIIEITETAEITEKKMFQEHIKQLKQLGFEIALDDFGTGHSSFDKILKMDSNYFKLDRSIIQNIYNETKNQYIVNAMVRLAHDLNVLVIAEGVETLEEEVFLRNCGIDFVQGYLYSRPVNSEKLLNLLEEKAELKIAEEDFSERRLHKRIKLPNYLIAYTTIDEINGKKVRLGGATVLINEISQTGLKCFSNVKIPNNDTIILLFKLTLSNQEYKVLGRIVHQQEKVNYFVYGVEFLQDSTNKEGFNVFFEKIKETLTTVNEQNEDNFTKRSICSYFSLES